MIRFRELTLGPWAEAHEKTILRDLLTPEERNRYFAKYRLDKLQATDLKTRYETYSISKTAGIHTTNEIRAMEDLNPVEGGDMLWMPLNMAPADQVAKGAQTDSAPTNNDPADDGDNQVDTQRALLPLVDDAQRRITARIANDVRQNGTKALRGGGRSQLSDWVHDTYADWRQAANDMLAPADQVARLLGVNLAADPARWIDDAVHAAVGELTNGN
ncbi:MAG: phage portal protein [Anaerolineales bacterium]|nr:phage portal protein [Anaerolineales bacterium]